LKARLLFGKRGIQQVQDLCETIQKYEAYGISYDDLPAFAPTDADNPPKENDISRVAGDIVSFRIFQNGKWVPFSLEATKEAVGYDVARRNVYGTKNIPARDFRKLAIEAIKANCLRSKKSKFGKKRSENKHNEPRSGMAM
jgi:hypothetical protein